MKRRWIEPFDELVSTWIFREETTNDESPPSSDKGDPTLWEGAGVKSEQLLKIRYQLLQRTLCASLAAQACGLSQAWMVVRWVARAAASAHTLVAALPWARYEL